MREGEDVCEWRREIRIGIDIEKEREGEREKGRKRGRERGRDLRIIEFVESEGKLLAWFPLSSCKYYSGTYGTI